MCRVRILSVVDVKKHLVGLAIEIIMHYSIILMVFLTVNTAISHLLILIPKTNMNSFIQDSGSINVVIVIKHFPAPFKKNHMNVRIQAKNHTSVNFVLGHLVTNLIRISMNYRGMVVNRCLFANIVIKGFFQRM
jgi:hypothetical protein